MRQRQRGVALLTAVLVVAIVTIIGTSMLTRMNFATHRSGNLWLMEQASWYVVGVEGWAGQILLRDQRDNDIDSLDQVWAQPVDYLPIEGGGIRGRIEDLQGRFNLNNLGGANAETAMTQFQRLLESTTDVDVVTVRQIAQSTRDWIDPDIQPTVPDGAEDDYYLGLDPPYRTANQPMESPSELRAVRGVTAAVYSALAPHITALPGSTAINVNTATPAVLAALADGVEPAALEALAERRQEEPWPSVQDFLREDAFAGRDVPAQGLSVTSSFFQVAGEVTVDRGRLRFFSVLQRSGDSQVRTVRRSRNVR